MLSYAQITILHQMPAQSIHYFEPSFNIPSYVQCGSLQSKDHLGSSFWAEKFVKTVFLVTDHPQPKLTPIIHVHFPYR